MNFKDWIRRTILGSTTSGREGALLVGTDTKTNLGSAATVEAALETLNTRAVQYVSLAATGPGFLFQASSGAAVTVVGSTVSATELGYLDGVTSAIQTQLDAKLNLAGGTLTGALTLNADPSNSLHAATKQYVDAMAAGLKWKTAVRCASKNAGTLSTSFENGDTVDGVVLATDDRILIKAQASSSENGIYTVNSSGAPTRATDADSFGELNGAVVFVLEGTEYANQGWMQTVELSSFSGQSWSQAFGTGLYLADGTTLTLTGRTFSVATGGIADAQVASGAAIAVNKLAAQTASRVAVYDSSGFLAASAITAAALARKNVVTTLTDASTINIDWSLGEKFEVLITDNRTLTYSNFVAGQMIYLRVQQDGAGSRTLTYPASHRGPGGAVPTLSTGANRVDWVEIHCRTGTTFDVFITGANLAPIP